MHRIDTPNAEADANGAGKDGFNDGEPGVLGATELDAAWGNGVQETLCDPIESAGITLVKGTHTQLTTAIPLVVGRASAYFNLSGTDGYTMSAMIGNPSGYVLAVSDTELTLPAAGRYKFELYAKAKTSDTSNPVQYGFRIDQNGTPLALFLYRRFSATASEVADVSGFAVVDIASVVDPITIFNALSVNCAIDGAAQLIVTRVR